MIVGILKEIKVDQEQVREHRLRNHPEGRRQPAAADPMSEVAGRMAIQQGAKYLEMAQGGHGVLLGGVPGVNPGTVVVISGGVVGVNAAKMAWGPRSTCWT